MGSCASEIPSHLGDPSLRVAALLKRARVPEEKVKNLFKMLDALQSTKGTEKALVFFKKMFTRLGVSEILMQQLLRQRLAACAPGHGSSAHFHRRGLEFPGRPRRLIAGRHRDGFEG